jgi:hypothetical protein
MWPGLVVVGARANGDGLTLRLADGRLASAYFPNTGELEIPVRLWLRARFERPVEVAIPGRPRAQTNVAFVKRIDKLRSGTFYFLGEDPWPKRP